MLIVIYLELEKMPSQSGSHFGILLFDQTGCDRWDGAGFGIIWRACIFRGPPRRVYTTETALAYGNRVIIFLYGARRESAIESIRGNILKRPSSHGRSISLPCDGHCRSSHSYLIIFLQNTMRRTHVILVSIKPVWITKRHC